VLTLLTLQKPKERTMTKRAARDEAPQPITQVPMTGRQVVAIAICVLLTALDGFDVLSISFASPGIAGEWNIQRAALGLVLSIELFGMAAGAVLLGQVADRIGRRKTTLGCLLIVCAGMLLTSFAQAIDILAATRLLTGLGIGGMLATTNALVAEYANAKWRSAAVAIMAGGYPLGAVVGGAVASALLVHGSWRSVFLLGAGMAALLFPLALRFMPEPVNGIGPDRQSAEPARAIASGLPMGRQSGDELAEPQARAGRPGLGRLMQNGMAGVTMLLTAGYFLHMLTFYFVLKWIPKIVADMGFAPSAAANILVWTNIGSLGGSVLFSLLSLRFRLRPLLVVFMLAGAGAVIMFGQTAADLRALSLAGATAGFFTNGVVVGLYALIAASYPSSIRAGGTGFVIGFGRGGAALGPIIGGALFQSGLGLPVVATVMAGGTVLAVLAVMAIPQRCVASGRGQLQ
jgi:benzoate transport